MIEVPGSVAVCFDAPTVELFEQRAEGLHPALARLGPDLLRNPFDNAEALRRLRDPSRSERSIAEALLDFAPLCGDDARPWPEWADARLRADAPRSAGGASYLPAWR